VEFDMESKLLILMKRIISNAGAIGDFWLSGRLRK
jgi:hypothetical protein